jgi:transposase-like protein
MVQVNIKNLIDEVQCYQTVRELRWPDGIICSPCQSKEAIKRGFDDSEPARQRYECHGCNRRFDDLTDTIFAGHHRPLKAWILCLYFMGLIRVYCHGECLPVWCRACPFSPSIG